MEVFQASRSVYAGVWFSLLLFILRRKADEVWKDVAVPGLLKLQHIRALLSGSRPLAERRLLASFAGKIWPDVTESARAHNYYLS